MTEAAAGPEAAESGDPGPNAGASEAAIDERRPRARFPWVDAACATFVVALTVAHLAYYFPRVVDDLFISLRFADNLAHGRGAVYNVGERVEGYSSPLWMLLQSVGLLVGVEGVTWTKVLGCASLFGLEYGLYRLTRDVFGVRGPLAWLPALACAANSYVVNWAVLGLEAPLHLAMIVLVPVAVNLALRDETRRSRGWATTAIVGLGLTRPESVLYLAANVVGPLLTTRSIDEAKRTGRRVAKLFLPGAAILVAMLALRRGYYGYFVPNTYFVKGSAQSFDFDKLAPLWGEGANPEESVTYFAGIAMLAYFGWAKKVLAPTLSALACAYFTASVRLDWMPSLRHLLPITVLSPVGWACLAGALAARSSISVRVLGWGTIAVPVLGFAGIAGVDNRNSPEENRGRGWIRPKKWTKWEDTVLAYRRVEPPHVSRMGAYEMGQITQAWHILEASAEPVNESWYVGRDIGAVGYYTGVKVFDTAGLFTPQVSHCSAWTAGRQVPDELIRDAMSKKPLAGEIYEGWELALGRDPDLLRGYRVRMGSARAPTAFLAVDRERPTGEEIERRYDEMVAKFPGLYHLHTLYGESVGAVVERRRRIVQQRILNGKL